MNYLWKLNQLKRVTAWEVIQRGCRGSTDYPHHQCILLAVLMILIQHLLRTQSPESHLTRGSFTHPFMVLQILMAVGAITCPVFIQLLILEPLLERIARKSCVKSLKHYIYSIALCSLGGDSNLAIQSGLLGS